jgi:hypothetical protein
MKPKTNLEKSLQEIENRDDVDKVVQKNGKILVLTNHFSYDAEYVQEIPTSIAHSSEKTFGMDINRGDERLDGNIVLTFHKDSEDIEEVFCMYASVRGVDPIALMNTKDKIECNDLYDVAEKIVSISTEDETGSLEDLKDTMNLDSGEKQNTSSEEGFSVLDL